jgi:hypothetical protein
MKAALEEYLGCGGGKGVKGVLVGTRRGDPNGGECDFESVLSGRLFGLGKNTIWCRVREQCWASAVARSRSRGLA